MPVPSITQLETSFGYSATPGTINTIQQTNPDPINNPQNAAYNTGFPAITMPLTGQTGRPPNGQDFNGILNFLSDLLIWYSVGGGFTFNGTLYNPTNPYITGYPEGCRVLRADGNGYWLNLLNDNQASPESATFENWVPDTTYGVYEIIVPNAGTTAITLTPEQAAYDIISIYPAPAVVLTLPITVTIPAEFVKSCVFFNATVVDVTVTTDAIPTNSILNPPNSYNIITSVNSDGGLISLSQYYLTQASAVNTYAQRPNVGNNGYSVSGNGASTALTTSNTVLNLVYSSGEAWISGNQISVPFSTYLTGFVFIQLTSVPNQSIEMEFMINGTTTYLAQSYKVDVAGSAQVTIPISIFLPFGDYLEIQAREGTGGGATAQIINFFMMAVAN